MILKINSTRGHTGSLLVLTKDIEMYFINTLSCCVSVFSFGRAIDFLGREWLLPPTSKTDRINFAHY